MNRFRRGRPHCWRCRHSKAYYRPWLSTTLSILIGIAAGMVVWLTLYRCDKTECMVSYANLTLCLTGGVALALVIREIYF